MCREWKLYIAKTLRDYAKSLPNMDGRIPPSSARMVRLRLGSSPNTQSVSRISNETCCDWSRTKSNKAGCLQPKKLTCTTESPLMKAGLNVTELKVCLAPTANTAAG